MRTWTIDEAIIERPPVPVTVTGHPLATTGVIVVEGRNPWIMVSHTVDGRERSLASARFSWTAVLDALDDPEAGRLVLDPGTPRCDTYTTPATPSRTRQTA